MKNPQIERRQDQPKRLDFDLWLYVKHGVEGEEFRKWSFERQEPVRAQFIADSEWHWIRKTSDALVAKAEAAQ